MPAKTLNPNTLTTADPAALQEGWKNLGVPLRPQMHADIHAVANRMGMKAAQWARLQLADALARALAA